MKTFPVARPRVFAPLRVDRRERSPSRAQVRGVTLMELLVALVIVGLLTAIAAISYHRSVQAGQLAHAKAELGQAQLLLERAANATTTGNYPTTVVGLVATDPNFTFAYPYTAPSTSAVPAAGVTDYVLTATGKGPAANVVAAVNGRQVRCFCSGSGCTAVALGPTDLVCPAGSTTF